MTKAQINKLVKDGDIWPVSSSTDDFDFSDFSYYNSDTKERIYISNDLSLVLRYFFDYFLDYELDEEREGFSQEIKLKEKHYQPGIALKKKLFNDLISEQIDRFNACFSKEDPIYLKNASAKKENFIFDLLAESNNPSKLIEIVKFEIFNGKKIDPTHIENTDISRPLELLRRFYYSDEMEKIYEIILLDENIKYLQKSLSKIENNSGNEHPVTMQGVAIACILKKILLYSSTNLDTAILKYFSGKKTPTKGRRQSLSGFYKGLYDSRTGKIKITISCDNIKTIQGRIDAINGIKYTLTQNELTEAEDLLRQLDKLKNNLNKN